MLKDLIERLSDLQIRRPWLPLLLVAAVTAVFGFFASKLELRTRYDQLLPDSQPSVKELHRVEARTANAQTVMILLEGPDRQALRAMGDALIPALLALGPDAISSAEDGTQAARAFLEPRAGLFLSQKELEKLHADVFARWDYEVAKESNELLEDTGPPVTVDDIESRFRRKKAADSGASGRDHTDGYYERKDGTGLVVIARSPIAGGDLATGPALEGVYGAVAKVKATRPEFAGIRAGYAGDMPTGFIEYDLIRNDLLSVGASGIALVLTAVLLYFMRLRALFVMGVSIAVALVWTFGLTEIVIGHLNVATGFLVSIVAGNGINVGILYQSRYFEERKRGVPPPEAMRASVRATWQPTVIAALASAASYLSLLVSDFSAFRHFGFIAASGMLLCWVVKTLMVPPMLLVLSERRFPIDREGKTGLLAKAIRRFGMGYGRVFAWLVPEGASRALRRGGRRRRGRRRPRRPLRPQRPDGVRPPRDRERPPPRRRAAPRVGRCHRGPRGRARRDGGAHRHRRRGEAAREEAPGGLGRGAEGRQAVRRRPFPLGPRPRRSGGQGSSAARGRRSAPPRPRQALPDRRRLAPRLRVRPARGPSPLHARGSPREHRAPLRREGRLARAARRRRARAHELDRPALPAPLLRTRSARRTCRRARSCADPGGRSSSPTCSRPSSTTSRAPCPSRSA